MAFIKFCHNASGLVVKDLFLSLAESLPVPGEI